LIPQWKQQILDWEAAGRPAPPPPPIKHNALLDTAKFGSKIFIETGTYMGDTLEAMLPHFEQLYSIEIYKPLYKLNRRRFNKNQKVTLVNGDSAEKLKDIVPFLDKPAIFWLDGHYSGQGTGKGIKDTPIYEELTIIFKMACTDFVILIDDARCFGNSRYPAYPTIPELRAFVEANSPRPLLFFVKNDIIHLIPKR